MAPTSYDPAGETHREWLARRPFTLALGSGFFGFFAHTGVLLALERAGLRPRRVTGVSAGALAGGLWASGFTAEALATELLALRRADFWDPGPPLGGFLRGKKFQRKLEELISTSGVRIIDDCPLPFAAVAYDVLRRRTVVLERGSLAAAIQASCTVPVMFRPRLHQGTLLIDGGVRDRNGEIALLDDDRVLLHTLASSGPWRHLRARRGGLMVPGTDARTTLAIPELPRVSPFRLRFGASALERAFGWTTRWLDRPRDL